MQDLADANAEIASRVARGREQQRRRRILRSILPLLLIGTLLLGGGIRLRNRSRLDSAKDAFQAEVAGLIQTVEQTGNLPVFYPPRGPDGLPTGDPGFSYVDSAMVRHLRGSGRELIVAHSAPVRQIMGTDLRVVAWWRDGRIEVQPMPTRECQEALAEQQRRTDAAVQAARDRGDPAPPGAPEAGAGSASAPPADGT